MIHDKCKSLSIFRSTLDFGTGHLQTCFSFHNMKKNIRKKLQNFPVLLDPAIKLYSNESGVLAKSTIISEFLFNLAILSSLPETGLILCI